MLPYAARGFYLAQPGHYSEELFDSTRITELVSLIPEIASPSTHLSAFNSTGGNRPL